MIVNKTSLALFSTCLILGLSASLLQQASLFQDFDRRLQQTHYILQSGSPDFSLSIQLISIDDLRLQRHAQQKKRPLVTSPIPNDLLQSLLSGLQQKGVKQVFLNFPQPRYDRLPHEMQSLLAKFDQFLILDFGYFPIRLGSDGVVESFCLGPPCMPKPSPLYRLCQMPQIRCNEPQKNGWQRPKWMRNRDDYSIYDQWQGKALARIPKTELEGRLVIITPRRVGMEQTYRIPKYESYDESVWQEHLILSFLESLAADQWLDDLAWWQWVPILVIALFSLTWAAQAVASRYLLLCWVAWLSGWWGLASLFFVANYALPLLLPLLFITGHGLYFLGYQWSEEKFKQQQLKLDLTKAELNALGDQLDTHGIANDLGLLSYLIEDNPKKAKQYLYALLENLRIRLQISKTKLICLSDEWDFIKNNITIQHLMQRNMTVEAHVEDDLKADLSAHQVPFLVFYPLFENAVKYALAIANQQRPLVINIHLYKRANRLIFEVRNPATQQAKARFSSKKGLANLHKRLSHFYGKDNFHYVSEVLKDGYMTRLEIPIHA